MLQFEHTYYLYGLAVLPVLVLLFFAANWSRRRALRRFGENALIDRLMPQASRYKHSTKFSLLLLAFVFFVLAWANPRTGGRKVKKEQQSIDVFLLMDLSSSMLARDIAPNRLERAQRLSSDLIEKLQGNRIGLILFAGSAFLQVPLTQDYNHLIQSLNTSEPGQLSPQGTSISAALRKAVASFPEENKNSKAIIVLSDGENHEPQAIAEAESARAEGIAIFTLGVGTPEGSFIPVQRGGRESYKRDENGNPVNSKLNEGLLREIASAGDGIYLNIAAPRKSVLQTISDRLQRIEKQDLQTQVFDEYTSYYQYPLGAGMLLLLLEFLISYRRNRYFADRDIFKPE